LVAGWEVIRLAEVRLQEGESLENALRRFKLGLFALGDEYVPWLDVAVDVPSECVASSASAISMANDSSVSCSSEWLPIQS
jgi:hypothetical protein